MIDPVSLRVLIAVCDTGSVTRAARLLAYSAPNVTQHLRKLEKALGTAMVARAGRGIVMTPAGLGVVERAREIVRGLDELAAAAGAESAPQGTFRIAAFPTALRQMVIPAIAQARSEYPMLDVVPTELEPEPALDLLRIGRIDALLAKALGTTQVAAPAPDGLTRIRLGVDPLDVVVPAGHRLATRRGVHLVELARERLALTPGEDPYGAWIASHSPDLFEAVGRAFGAVELQSLVRYVELGLAVTVLPRMGRPHLPPSVVSVPLDDDDAFRTIELHVRSIAARSRTVTAVVDMLRRHLREGGGEAGRG
ncbi:LysR family transcriptional regulator [Litorihabitans aurantiacus]|uniref:HTH lysR-type domain-containing protein n=1 Tax=Litorihabitans aurantiacus TaxID=1930061 RepID=A0AA38CUU4_9MICO|nr:LysR family transcriptional regulator [Litorihabitans aurantiacus]GMA32350.1 hypothetical protein GCM10025875_23420 [Litorihabitans aurantiacus]